MSEASGVLLMPAEAEHYVRSLKKYDLKDVGSSSWLDQHEYVEQLNKTAHQQAKDGTDEFVMEFFNIEDKMNVLISNLITVELWKEKVFPLLLEKIASMSCLRNYLPLYHEASVLNLIEVLMYYESIALSCGDMLIDLVDYCYRKLTYLIHKKNKDLWPQPADQKELLTQSDLDLLKQQNVECEFHICTSCISVFQSLTQHRKSLPLTITTRMIDTQDVLLTLVPLMEKAPWIRKTKAGILQKFEEHEWISIAEDEHTKLPRLQGTLWLAIYNLVMDSDFQSRYEMSSVRRANLLRLRRFLHELVFDQIPPLADLLRALENLSLQGEFQGVEANPTPFLVEVVAEFRETLLASHEGSWDAIAASGFEEIFSVPVPHKDIERMGKMVTIPEDLDDPVCGNCGGEAAHRCSRCKNEWYCSRECQVAHWSAHESTCNMFLEAAKEQLDRIVLKHGSDKARDSIQIMD